MIDSINYILRDIEWVNFDYLLKQGIIPKEFKNVNKSNGFTNICYSFNFKGVEFKYNKSYKIITVLTNTHRILNKRDVTLNDLEEYKSKLQEIISTVFNNSDVKLELNRVDYCVDIPLSEEDIKVYHSLLYFNRKSYKYMKQEKLYLSSTYLKNKKGKTNINFYHRYSKTQNEDDKGILRLELQCKKKLIKSEYYNYGIPKEIEYYWSKSAMEEYYFNYLRNYLYEGDYYTISKSKEIINNSEKLKPDMKRKLKNFIRRIGKLQLSNLMDPEFCKIKKFDYTIGKINYYIEKLNSIGVNPIPIQNLQGVHTDKEYLPNLLKLIKQVSEDKYFK